MTGIMDYLTRNADALANGIGGVGETLMALDQGRAPNLAPYQLRTAQLMERQRFAGMKQGIMDSAPNMTPQQLGIMSATYDADPQAVIGIMAQQAFPKPSDQSHRFKVVPNVGLVDTFANGGPEVTIAAPQRPEKVPGLAGEYAAARANGIIDPSVSFADYAAMRRSSFNVNTGDPWANLGKPSPGNVFARNPDGTPKLNHEGAPFEVPIVGGQAEREASEAAKQAQGREDQSLRAFSVISDDIGRARALIEGANWPATGLGGSLLSNLPGSAAHDLSRMMDSLKANSAFSTLQQMRENSPTGGALGSVSAPELRLLESAQGSLEQSQSKEQLLDNLARFQNLWADIVFGAGNGPTRVPISFRQGDVNSRLEFLSAQYPEDPNKVLLIMKSEGLL